MLISNKPSLRIGNLEISPPIIQGGMGVRISRANLASAVANVGCVGVISTAGIGTYEDSKNSFSQANCRAIREEIRAARLKTNGIIGVNIMVALSDYEDLVKTCSEENVDIIISGAGLPLDLPKYTQNKDIKLIPIVSSVRAFQIIYKRWVKHFNKSPDAVVVEGSKAGGHLGYKHDDLVNDEATNLEQTVREVVAFANSCDPRIPVIAAGGVFDGSDIARFLTLGASGVQMATRFVCTDECDAHINFKKAYLNATADDITIIKSPVGLPGRVIKNEFVEKINSGMTIPFKCRYKCLKSCDPQKAPYCIAQVLADAAEGKMDRAFAFAGTNAYRCENIISVKNLVAKLSEELRDSLAETYTTVDLGPNCS